MRKIGLLVLVIILCAVIGVTAVFGSDNIPANQTYTVAIDPVGNMRLLSPDLNGRYNNEPRPNEYIIELASMESVVQLQEMLMALQEDVTDLEERLTLLEEIVDDLSNEEPPTGPSPIFEFASHIGASPPSDTGNNDDVTWVQLDSGLWVNSYNGSSSVIAVATDDVEFETNDFTVCAWINPTSSTSNKVIYYNGDVSAPRTGIGIAVRKSNDSSNPNKFYLETSADAAPTALYGDAVTYDRWQFVCATFSSQSQTATVYQNGVQMNTSTGTLSVPTWTGENRTSLGAAYYTNSARYVAYYGGSMGIIRLYDHALSELEIMDIYTATRHLFGL